MFNETELCWTIMAKQTENARAKSKKPAGMKVRGSAGTIRSMDAGRIVSSRSRVEAVMIAAGRSGLLGTKSDRIGGRVSPVLVREAKAQTGIETDTDLIEFALANIALEDKFAESFKAVRGTVDPDLKLGF